MPRPATPSQVSYLRHLLKQVGGEEPVWDTLTDIEASALIDGLKQKRGRPVWYGNGQFSHWEKRASELEGFLGDFFRRYPLLKHYAPTRIVEKMSAGGGGHPEARQHGSEIQIFPKFWNLKPDGRDFVLAHEIGHYVESEYGARPFLNACTELGVDPWDTLNLPFGQFNMDEAFADSFASYHTDRDVQRRYPAWAKVVERVTRQGSMAARVAARPIPIDKKRVAMFVQADLMPKIERWLTRQSGQDEPLGRVEMITRDHFRVEDVGGRTSHQVDVVVAARPSSAKGAAVLAGRTLSYTEGEEQQIVLYVNGALSPNDILVPTQWSNRMQPIWSCTYETCLPYGLYSILIHELTHAADVFPHKVRYDPSKVGDPSDPEWVRYINDPSEIRAFMQQIVDETTRHAKQLRGHLKSNQDLVKKMLLLSTTWGVIESVLTPRNRALILRAVYVALDEKGVLLASTMADRVAARYMVAAGYFQVGDRVTYGKYKNKSGKVVGFGSDKWGNPTVEIEPIPKGRKQNKVFGLYRIWRADVKEKALAEQAAAAGTHLGADQDDEDDNE